MGDEEEEVKTQYEWKDGDQETTEWLSRAGVVKVTYPNGDTYEGEYNDLKKRHGKGTYVVAPPRGEDEEEEDEEAAAAKIPHVYRGDWINGEKHGVGRMTYPNGDSYYGQWMHNTPHGEGTYKYANGDMYSGQWAKGVKSGAGTYVYAANDSQLVGTWEEGNYVSGRWVHKDGTSWHGKFRNEQPVGAGSFYTKAGNAQAGEYVEMLNEEGDEEGSTYVVWSGKPVTASSADPTALLGASVRPRIPEVSWDQKVDEKADEDADE